MTTQEKLKEDILTNLSKLDVIELELLKSGKAFEASEIIDEAIRRKGEQ